jgi:hypothetical protein
VLGIGAGAQRVFDRTPGPPVEPAVRRYLSDMVGPYGVALREDLLDDGAEPCYGEMAEALIGTLVAGAPVDLLILTFGMHDARLGRATATYLSGRCPGEPLAFALCDQGVLAAFSALRVIGAYADPGDCRRALLLAVEQPVVHYQLAEPAPLPDRHAAAALLLESSAASGVTVRRPVACSPAEVAAVLAAEVAALSAGRSKVTLIAGAGLAAAWSAESVVDDVRLAPPGRPYTGMLAELSRDLPRWRAQDRLVLLADYDAALGLLCSAAAEFVEGGDPMAIK